MTQLWFAMSAFALCAACFVLWPLWRHRALTRATFQAEQGLQRKATNIELYREHMGELDASREHGDIDAEQYTQLKLELDRSLLEDGQVSEVVTRPGAKGRYFLIACVFIVPAMAVLYYQQFGAGADWEIRQLLTEKHRSDMQTLKNQRPVDRTKARTLIAKLETRLEARPENLRNWHLLARTYFEVRDVEAAVKAYQRILQRDSNSSQVMAELAQVLFAASDRTITPEIELLLQRTLRVDPANSTALGLSGIRAFQSQQYQRAIDFWQRALAQMGQGEAGVAAFTGGIARAKQLLAEAGNSASASEAPAAVAKDKLQVTVSISLDGTVPIKQEQVVYVYARAWQGPKMPLAIARLSVADLPTSVVLKESMSMAPGMSLASFPKVELVARLSQTGKPTAQPGDWEATKGPLVLAELSGAVPLVINSLVR